MTDNSARRLVVEALGRMDSDDAWSGPVLDSALGKSELSREDKSFASALFYRTLVYRYTIDQIIGGLSSRPLSKLDNSVLNILRISVCQLAYMDSVPDHAAVSEGVKLTRTLKKTSASGFVNALLRGFLRSDKAVPKGKTPLEQLALDYSCPQELIALWQKSYGEEKTLEILRASLESPPTFLRTNTLKNTTKELLDQLTNQGFVAREVDGVPNCISIEEGGSVHALSAFEKGLFHIQDVSSQKVALTVGAKPDDTVLDCCSAPGGKAFVMAEEMEDRGSVIACDLHPHRLTELSLRQKSLGITSISTKKADMSLFHEDLGEFDRVLCDVPCSGYGAIRRRPEIKYHSLNKFSALPQLQFSILNNGAKYCKNGGILVYSTCTLVKEENQNVVEKFLRSNPKFQILHEKSAVKNGFGSTIFIGESGGDGFFVTVFQKETV